MMQHPALGSVLTLAATAFLFGCRSDILKEEPLVKPGYGAPVARATVVDGLDCPGKANLAAIPEHCAWPVSAARDPIVTVDVQVVTRVDAAGSIEDVRVLRAPDGEGFDEAAVACARRAQYKPPVGSAGAPAPGETCPLTFRLTRYVTDLDPTRLDRPCPPALETYGAPAAAGGPSAGDNTPLRCP